MRKLDGSTRTIPLLTHGKGRQHPRFAIMSDIDIAKNLSKVNDKVALAYHLRNTSGAARNPLEKKPRLVAVSKTKPVESILQAYKLGQRHFGENYVQELVEKSQNPLLAGLEDICWHFIGHLQRNKCNNVISCPHLWAVETVDTERLASTLDSSWKKTNNPNKLKVFVQINTSGEASKHGCLSDAAPALVKHIIEECSNLTFCGLMTIGRIGHDYSIGPNPDFESLLEAQRKVSELLRLDVELSMGMSSDYEEAIRAGSTNIRVGSCIFGSRDPK